MRNRDAPLGVFDSGLGGLTVLRAIQEALPEENTIYLGDTARVPYGIRSPEVVLRYCFESLEFFHSRGIKLLVLACNTATSIALEQIRRNTTIPVVGVIEPGARAAVRAGSRIGVIGTDATVASGAYQRAIRSLSPESRIVTRACPLFVPLAEEGWVDDEIAERAARRYLGDMGEIDALVLGCTHYPLLKTAISRVMRDVPLIDSAVETAHEVTQTLDRLQLRRTDRQVPPFNHVFVTDKPQRFSELVRRFLGHAVESISQIELT